MANPRRHRLELPAVPSSSDPKVIQKYLSDIRRLTMDEFNRLSVDYFDFQQEVIAAGTVQLLAPAAIAITPAQYSAVIVWENPAQTFGNPTHVRVRIAEFGETWTEYTYPLTTWTANGLAPSTPYTFQIQYVRRESGSQTFLSSLRNCPSVPVQVQSLSEIRSRSFTTLGGVGAPTGPGPGTIPIPPTDNPGPVGGPGCWWEWQLQIVDLTTGEWSDTTTGGFLAGSITTIPVDITTLDPLRVYRIKYREICDGVPGPWNYGPPFTGGDLTNACGGLSPTASRSLTPFDSADLFVAPHPCLVSGQGVRMRELLSGVEIIPGAGFDLLFADSDGEWDMLAQNWGDGSSDSNTRLLGSTVLPILTELDNTDDFSIYVEIKSPFLPAPPIGGFATSNVFSIGGGVLNLDYTYDGLGNIGVQFIAPRETGGQIVLRSALDYGIDIADYLKILVRSDADGNKNLRINGIQVAEDTTGQEIRLDGINGQLQFSSFSRGRYRKAYGWNRYLDDSELGDLFGFLTGGIETEPGDGYHYHTFINDGTLTWHGVDVTVQYIIVGGGGGAGGLQSFVNGNAGGGGGHCVHGTTTITASESITIGAGGTASGNRGNPGASTVFGSVGTAAGGGAGANGGAGKTGGTSGNETVGITTGSPGVGGQIDSGGGAGAGDHTTGTGVDEGFGGTSGSLAGGGYNWQGLGVWYGGGGNGITQSGNHGLSTLGRNNGTPTDAGHDGWGQGGHDTGRGGSGVVIVRYLI